MRPRSPAIPLAVLALLVANEAAGDTVKLVGKPAFRNVTISGFRNGRLVFRGVSEQYLRKPLAQIEWLEIDRLESLSLAERAAAAERWPEAADAYEIASKKAGKQWLRRLIHIRLIEACDRGGRFERAVALYIELVNRSPTHAGQVAPRHPGQPGCAANRAARERLRQAIDSAETSTIRRPLQLLLLEAAIFDEVADPLRLLEPRDLSTLASVPSASTAPAKPAASQSAPKTFGMLSLKAEKAKNSNPTTSAPTAGHTETPAAAAAVSPLRLPADSFVLSAARRAFEEGDYRRAVRLLEPALEHVAADQRPPWKLLFERCRLETGLHADAASELLRLANSGADGAVASEALYYVGVAHERMNRADVAVKLYRELLAMDELPAGLRMNAERALERLGE